MRNVLALIVAALVLGGPVSASALNIPLIDLRVGVRGGANVNILPDVDEPDQAGLVYPGFLGLGWVVGGGISFDYMDIVGIEIDFLYSSEKASGAVEWDRDLGGDNKKEESDFTLEATALHIPILIRGQIPTGLVRPFLHVGVDFAVNRDNADMVVERRGDAPPFTEGCTVGIDCDPFPQELYGANNVDSATSLLIGVGVDIDVRDTVTIPIELRGLLRPGMSSSVVDRVTEVEGQPRYLYNNEWQYQVFIMFGANYVIF